MAYLRLSCIGCIREVFGLLVRCFVEKLSCVLMSRWCKVTSSPKGDNPGALPFAGRCLSGLEITDLFGRLRYKELSSHLLLHSTEQGTCISGQLCSWPLPSFCPYQCPAGKKQKDFVRRSLQAVTLPLLSYFLQSNTAVNWTLSSWGGLV